MIIDTHAHLDFPDYKSDLDSVLIRAKEADAGFFFNLGAKFSATKKKLKVCTVFITCFFFFVYEKMKVGTNNFFFFFFFFFLLCLFFFLFRPWRILNGL